MLGSCALFELQKRAPRASRRRDPGWRSLPAGGLKARGGHYLRWTGLFLSADSHEPLDSFSWVTLTPPSVSVEFLSSTPIAGQSARASRNLDYTPPISFQTKALQALILPYCSDCTTYQLSKRPWMRLRLSFFPAPRENLRWRSICVWWAAERGGWKVWLHGKIQHVPAWTPSSGPCIQHGQGMQLEATRAVCFIFTHKSCSSLL